MNQLTSIPRRLELQGCFAGRFELSIQWYKECSIHIYIYHPSKLVNKNQKDIYINENAGGWVHLASLVELMKGVVIRNYNDVPFYFRAMTRLVPWEYMHAILAHAALTESDALSQVGVDNSRWLWVRYLIKDQDVLPSRAETGALAANPYKFEKDGSYYKDHPYLWACFHMQKWLKDLHLKTRKSTTESR